MVIGVAPNQPRRNHTRIILNLNDDVHSKVVDAVAEN